MKELDKVEQLKTAIRRSLALYDALLAPGLAELSPKLPWPEIVEGRSQLQAALML